jgi:SAM-dependent methyltransferase
MNIPADAVVARDAVFERAGTISTWDKHYYHPVALPFYDRAVARMLDAMDAPRGSRVLDAGCGPGEHSIRVARLGRRVHAIDISSAMLEEARRRVQASGLARRIRFQRQDLTRLELRDASFRYVFCWGVVIHIREIDQALAELARVLAPGGRLALWVTNMFALDHAVERLARRILRKPLDGAEALEPGIGIRHRFQDETLWVWRLDPHWLVRFMEVQGLVLRRRLMGAFTELHVRAVGPFRSALLRLNNVALATGHPVGLSATSLFVFEKAPAVQ